MKRFFILTVLIFIFSIIINCTKSEEPEPETGYKRNVVIEMFTFHGCQNCPIAEQAIDSLFGIYGDSLVVLEYHLKQMGDTLSPCSSFVNERKTLYNVVGCPTVVFDGLETYSGVSGDIYNTYLNCIADRFSKRSPLKCQTLSADFVGPTSIAYNVSIISENDISGKLFILLSEDSVTFEDSLYNFVVRQVYPDDNGIDFSISADNPFNSSGSILLSWQPKEDVWVSIFIQHMTDHTIYQGGSINIGKPAVTNPYQFDFSVSPDTFQAGTPGTFSYFSFLLTNTGSDTDRYYIEASQVQHIPTWQWMMCSGGLCKFPDGGTILDTIPPLDSLPISTEESDSFTIDVKPDSTVGIEIINVKITSQGDSTVMDSVKIYTEVQ